ncbi:hypothetical protein SH528x_005851 [Novipirellula sp. SH528]|uniref:hypothetical protein n=1 Tax=Novipirellula sp. SH528 TaxID=3454466 RepID=UPI003FA0B65E
MQFAAWLPPRQPGLRWRGIVVAAKMTLETLGNTLIRTLSPRLVRKAAAYALHDWDERHKRTL